MKKIFFTLLLTPLLTSISAFANIPDLPKGQFIYEDTTAISTNHQRIINVRSEAGRKLYNEYRELGYSCSRKPNYFVKCKKTVNTNPNKIKFKTDRLSKLSPDFGELIAAELITEAELVDTYQVTQAVSFEDSSTNTYKVYQNHRNGKTYLDIQTELIRPFRFSFTDGEIMHLSFEKENLGKNEFLLHTLMSNYSL